MQTIGSIREYHLYKSTQSLNRGLLILLPQTRFHDAHVGNHPGNPAKPLLLAFFVGFFFENYVCPGWEEWCIEAQVARVLPNGPLLDLVCLVNTCKIIWNLATACHVRTSISNPRALNTNGLSLSDTGPIEFQTHGPEAIAIA